MLHLKASSAVWHTQMDSVNGATNLTLVVTTDSKVISDEQANASDVGTVFGGEDPTIIVDTRRLTPSFVFTPGSKETVKEVFMHQAYRGIQEQLLPAITVANCCHDQNRLINDFLMEGMGMAPTHTFRCLQDLVDPVLRVCCADDMRCIQSKTVGIADSKS
jgi:hypothetical protein